jgi:hypothetical protein
MTPPEDGTQQVIVPELPELPLFDRRRTRRAVWRGILRTAWTVIVGLLVVSMLWHVVGVLWFYRNEDHFKVVAGQGFYVAHPGYQFSPASCCDVGSALDGELTLNLSPRGPGGSGILRIRENWLGRIDPLPQEVADNPTPTETALTFGPPEKAVTARLLGQLPAPMTATAIVEFTKPMDQAAFDAWAARYDQPLTFHQTVFMSTVYPHARPTAVQIDQALAWPDPDVAAFRGWADQLRKSDGANLETLRLPSARIIKQLAAEGRIHGLLIDSTSIPQLRALLADRAVASVRVADVAFDLSQQGD